jgi:hypothetical protein
MTPKEILLVARASLEKAKAKRRLIRRGSPHAAPAVRPSAPVGAAPAVRPPAPAGAPSTSTSTKTP